MTRAELLERYQALPLPTTQDEHWRFTDLAGFDPDAWSANGATGIAPPPSLIDVDVAGIAHVGEGGIEIERAPDGIRFEPLTDEHELLYSLVGFDEKFAAHNAALWKHGLLVHVPRGVVARLAPLRPYRQLRRRRLALLAPVDRRGAGEPLRGDRGVRVLVPRARRVLERRGRDRRPAGGEGRVRLRPEPLARDLALRIPSRARRAGRRARLGRGRLRLREGKDPHPERPRRAGATSRVTGAYFADGTQHLDYDTFQEHMAPSTTSDFAFKGALRDKARTVWRGMIRVEEGAQKTNAYQENRNLLLSKTAHADSIPGLEILANDVRCTHGATLGQVDREQLFYLMTRGLTRAEAERLIVRGFFQDVLDRVELEPVRDALAAALEARIPQAYSASLTALALPSPRAEACACSLPFRRSARDRIGRVGGASHSRPTTAGSPSRATARRPASGRDSGSTGSSRSAAASRRSASWDGSPPGRPTGRCSPTSSPVHARPRSPRTGRRRGCSTRGVPGPRSGLVPTTERESSSGKARGSAPRRPRARRRGRDRS